MAWAKLLFPSALGGLATTVKAALINSMAVAPEALLSGTRATIMKVLVPPDKNRQAESGKALPKRSAVARTSSKLSSISTSATNQGAL
jgi:hypothetical protein